MALPVFHVQQLPIAEANPLRFNSKLAVDWLVRFLRQECVEHRGITEAVIGLSGGVDSAVVAYLAAKAFGADHTHAVMMPYKSSSQQSVDHAQIIVDQLGIKSQTVSISDMVDGYADFCQDEVSPQRLGNICARCRMIVMFDQSSRLNGLPIGTGNKSERLFGYFTWHADDSPPINPLGDLFKTQVWDLARELGVPNEIIDKPASADLVKNQTDESDFGITYLKADKILYYMTAGYPKEKLVEMGFDQGDVNLVWQRVASTHWKRRLPTVAMMGYSTIGEYYLRPVDY